MNIERQVLILVLCLFLVFAYLRGFLFGLKRYRLNISENKKRRKGETFIEWLLYKRYRDVIPPFLYAVYFLVIALHLVGISSCLILCMFCVENIGGHIAIGVVMFDSVWLLIISLLFWNDGSDYAYKRWMKKGKRKNKRK